MGKLLNIKGKDIGTGKPHICVPVMRNTKGEIIHEVRQLVEASVKMIEWRVDAFEKTPDLNAIREVLDELTPIIQNTIFIYTFRSKEQGGLMQLTAEQIYDLHQIAAESHIVDFIDVEFFGAKQPEREIVELQNMGAHVIASHHDFSKTPDSQIIRVLLEQMNQSGADVVKLAVMPQTKSDVIRLLEETNYFHENYPNTPLVTMSMGAIGGISRIAGEFFGSCITFGTMGQMSAPGQLPAESLDMILETLHNSMK